MLCEDAAQERFLVKLCRRRWGRLPDRVQAAPCGLGSAANWVLKQYPAQVGLSRQKRHERVALIVMIDGNTEGLRARKRALARALAQAGLEARSRSERIALCVPTRNIETWLQAANEAPGVDEGADYKSDWRRREAADRGATGSALDQPITAGSSIALPSWHDALRELERLD